MATMIANFTPTTAAAKAYGYQIPSTSPTSDPLFPQWLCNVNLPPGLVTMGCGSASSLIGTCAAHEYQYIGAVTGIQLSHSAN